MKRASLIFFVILSCQVFSQQRNAEGKLLSNHSIIRWQLVLLDSIDREPIPFASVSIGGKSFNTDFKGQITSEHLAEAIYSAGPQPCAGIKFIGYKDKYVRIVGGKDTVLMQRDDGIDLHAVKVEAYGEELMDVDAEKREIKEEEFSFVRCCRCAAWNITFIDSESRKPIEGVIMNVGKQRFVSNDKGTMVFPYKLYVDGRKALYQTAKSKYYDNKDIGLVPDNDTIALTVFSGIELDEVKIEADVLRVSDCTISCPMRSANPVQAIAPKDSLAQKKIISAEKLPALINDSNETDSPDLPSTNDDTLKTSLIKDMEVLEVVLGRDTTLQGMNYQCCDCCNASYSSGVVEVGNAIEPGGNRRPLLKEDIENLPVLENVEIIFGGIPGTYGDVPHFVKP